MARRWQWPREAAQARKSRARAADGPVIRAEEDVLAAQGQGALGDVPVPGVAAQLLTMDARGLAALPQPELSAFGGALLHAEQALDNKLSRH